MCEFRNRCREFVDRLVDVILGQQVVSSDFLQRLYCFCPELLLEGDNRHVFQLFSRLVRVLERCGCHSGSDAQSSREEFATFVVEAGTRHRESEKSAEQIKDVTEYLFSDYSFMSRRSLVQVLKVCCLVVDRPQRKMPEIEIDLKDCAVPVAVVTSSLRSVQSLVSSPGYKQGAFVTQGTMESVRDAIASSRDFMSCASFDPWESVSCGDRSSFVRKYSSAFDAVRRVKPRNNCTVQTESRAAVVFRSLVVRAGQVSVVLLALLYCPLLRLLLLLLNLVLIVGRRGSVRIPLSLHWLLLLDRKRG